MIFDMFSTSTKTIYSILVYLGISAVFGFLLFLPNVSEAASYEALLVSQSGSGTLTMEPGETKNVLIEFLNTSDVVWGNDGAGYLSVYTYDPKYRRSDFDPGTWLSPEQVKRIQEASVSSGEKATVLFQLHAPTSEGEYTETFRLASEDTAWVAGGEFTFDINVTSEQRQAQTIVLEKEDTTAEAGPSVSLENDSYKAGLVVQSANRIKALAGRPILFTAAFENIGTKAWSTYGLRENGEVSLAATKMSFAHPSWSGAIAYEAAGRVAPGEKAILSFAFNSPEVNGTHTAVFQLMADGEAVEDALIYIPIEVTGGAEAVIEAEEIVRHDGVRLLDIHEAPQDLRVGVLIVDEETDWEVKITSAQSAFDLFDIEGNILAKLDANQVVTAYYTEGHYYYDIGRGLEVSSYGLRFIPEVENAVMTVTNFDMRVTRNAGLAYNRYRNVLELRHNDYKDRTWLINELPMELYARGTGETSNISPAEFQKALMVTYRTYAYYHYTHGTKRGKEFMHLISTADDQVYFGYDREEAAPRVTDAVDATRGVIVTYDNELAITPYFSRSDGRTRDWSEVWGGDIAWLKGVDVPCDEGKTMWGHGVGMSAQGALCMANEGWGWNELLEYFYTDIELQRWWE